MRRRSTSASPVTANAALQPYLPQLVVDWLEHTPCGHRPEHRGHRRLRRHLRLHQAHRAPRRAAARSGAEEMGDTLNLVFGELLTAAYAYGAGLVKWGGDAVLLLFQGEGHPARAAAAAAEMQRVIARVGRIRTSSGDGAAEDVDRPALRGAGLPPRRRGVPGADRHRAGRQHGGEDGDGGRRPARSWSARTAPSSSRQYGARLGASVGPGLLMRAPPETRHSPRRRRQTSTIDLAQALPAALTSHLLGGEVAYEHRGVAVCFVEFSGVDALRRNAGLAAIAHAVEQVVSACQVAATAHDVTFLSSDIYPDGGKVILVAGAPRSAGDDVTRMLGAARQILDSDHALPLRVGVNVGRVFAGDYGLPTRRVYSADRRLREPRRAADGEGRARRARGEPGGAGTVADAVRQPAARAVRREGEERADRGRDRRPGPHRTHGGSGRGCPRSTARRTRPRARGCWWSAFDSAVDGGGRVVDVNGHPGHRQVAAASRAPRLHGRRDDAAPARRPLRHRHAVPTVPRPAHRRCRTTVADLQRIVVELRARTWPRCCRCSRP